MTAQEFLEKWPETVRKKNRLLDLACLECGQRDHLRMELSTVCAVTDAAFEPCGDGADWDFNSWCMCTACNAEGDASNFHVDGLDTLIAQREMAEEVRAYCDSQTP